MNLAKNSTLGTGFRLEIGLAEIHKPRMWVERHPDSADSQVIVDVTIPVYLKTSEHLIAFICSCLELHFFRIGRLCS